MKTKQKLILMVFVLMFLLSFCSKRIYQVAYPTLLDGEYDSEFPYKSCSSELQSITKTVRKLTAISYYHSFVFDVVDRITVSDIKNNRYRDKTINEIYYNNSVIGTATVLLYESRRLALLTCAHVVDFPDTEYTYFKADGSSDQLIQSVSFKRRQSNFIADLPEKGELEILAFDRSTDLAILGRQFLMEPRFEVPVFNYHFGKAADLEWGSFVYFIGFPKGYQMVTRGIVSQPNHDKQASFLVDALFNRGFSAGIVLAIRDGVPNFELVGIASSVSADFEFEVKPPENMNNSQVDPRIPYRGDVYVDLKKKINYGITFVISAETIIDFLKQNEILLINKGFNLSTLYQKN